MTQSTTIYPSLTGNMTPFSSNLSIFTTEILNTTAAAQGGKPLSKDILYGIFILNGILSLLGLLGNMGVCMVIIRGRKMYTIANLFLMNLAIADICVLVVSYPLWIIQTFKHDEWPFGSALCKIIPAVSDAFYGVSLGCMTTISIHRYRMILHAMDRQLSFFHAKIIIIFIWLISLGSISAPLYPVMKYYEGNKFVNVTVGNTTISKIVTSSICNSQWPNWTYERSYQIFLTIVWYFLPLIIIFVSFLRIKFYLQKQMQYEWLKGSEHNVLITNHILGIRKALRMLAPVVIVFAILMLPWNMLRILSVGIKLSSVKNAYIYILVSGTMLVANSVVNPFIYYIMSKEFRIEFRKQFWLLKNALRLTSKSDQYIIEANKDGRKYVRRFQSFAESPSTKRDANGNFSRHHSMKSRTESTSTGSSLLDYKFSNGAPPPDYDEMFKQQTYGIYNGDNYNGDIINSNGDIENSNEDNSRHPSTSIKTEGSNLYSIMEENSGDLDSKDSGFDGNMPSDKNLNCDSDDGNEKEDKNLNCHPDDEKEDIVVHENVSLLASEEVIKETVL